MEKGLLQIQNKLIADQSLRLHLIHQLEKDLAISFLNESDQLETIFNSLCDQLDQNPQEWSQWLYRIDVPENRISALQITGFTLENVALLILEREMQKILFRSQYGS